MPPLPCAPRMACKGAATARIARAAGVANGTLFHHFPSKELLIQQLYQDVKLRLGAAISEADPALPSGSRRATTGVRR